MACSRVGSPRNLKFAVFQKANGSVEEASNVVFSEVLLDTH